MSYTVVSPVFRTGPELPELIRRLRRLPGARILLVEDSGGDGAEEVLRREADDRVGALLLAENVGQNRALLAGLALAGAGPAVVLDADLQDPPEAVPLLVEGLARAPVVFARRIEEGRPLADRATSWLFKGLLRLASGFRLPSGAGAFVAMREEVVRHLLACGARDPYLVGLLARSGFRMEAVPVRRDPRPGGRTAYGWRARLRLGLRALGLLHSPTRPVAIRERLGWAGEPAR